MKKILGSIIVLVLLFSLLPVIPTLATDYGPISFGSVYEGIITTQNNRDRYQIVLTQAGRVTINVTSGLSSGLTSANINLLDSEGKTLRYLNQLSMSLGTTPFDGNVDLDTGTYYIAVFGSYSTGTYNLIVDFSAAGDNVIEDNSTLNKAYPLISNKTAYGFIGISTDSDILNDRDYYRLDLSEAGKVTINVTSGLSGGLTSASINLLDSEGKTLRYLNQSSTSLGTTPFDGSVDLDAGTYYIAVFGSYSTGTYRITTIYGSNQVTQQNYTITAITSTGGTVSGSGTYGQNASVTLSATPNSGFMFEGWYENGTRVNTNATYLFSVTANRTLEARFTNNSGQTFVEPDFDNPHSTWAREELNRAFAEDLVPPLLLDPNVDLREPISRVEFAGVVVKTFENLSGTNVQPASGNPFTDTIDIYARMAYNTGLMVGISANSFSPDMILNRETAATALTRVFKKWYYPEWSIATDDNFTLNYTRPSLFADNASISGWAWDSVYFMASNGIIQGFPDNTFRARNSGDNPYGYADATREQALIIALRMVKNLR